MIVYLKKTEKTLSSTENRKLKLFYSICGIFFCFSLWLGG